MASAEIRTCQSCQRLFGIEPDDFAFYETIKVPAPTFCPECREQRRTAFRNERTLYKRKCDLCGKDMISMYSPEPPLRRISKNSKPYTIYCPSCYWSDSWDPYSYGREYDFSKPFFEQFRELQEAVPRVSLVQENAVNSDWVNYERNAKNSYLGVGGEYTEDCAYTTYAVHSKNCVDCYWMWNTELAYESLKCGKCYKIFYSFWCFDCQDTWFSYDCAGCSNIIGCAGLRRKSYHIFNKPVSKDEYQAFVKENLYGSHNKIRELVEKSRAVQLGVPHRDAFILKSARCSGNFIEQSKNCENCWDEENVEDSKHLYLGANMKNCYDASPAINNQFVYEVMSCGEGNNTKFSYLVWRGHQNLEYCNHMYGGNDCFGSIGLRQGSYVILNKRYSREEYFSLREKIIAQMNETPYMDQSDRIYRYGEFFPYELSCFGYNETLAVDYFPLAREDALVRGFLWNDYDAKSTYKFSDYEIPDDLRNVNDDILEKVLKCETSDKGYRIIPMELQFYRQIGLPVPRRAPLQRHKDRMALLPPRKLFSRQCECGGAQSDRQTTLGSHYANNTGHFHGAGHCPNAVQTSYAPDRPEIVYCEECYQAEVS